jgi:uncharacterized protein
MGLRTAIKAIGMTSEQSKTVSFSFFGGEPLLRFDWIRDVVAVIRGMRGKKATFHITTNGTLLTREMADFFVENNFTYIVSCDGIEEIHNKMRPMAKKGTNSFEETMNALAIMKEAGCSSVTLRSTFTRDLHDIPAQVIALNLMCRDGLGHSLSVEPVSSSESSCIDPAIGKELGFDTRSALGLRDEYHEAYAWCLDEVKKGNKVFWHHLNHMARRVMFHELSPSECGAAKGYAHITPDGLIYACHREPGEPVGDVDQGYNERRRACWMDNRLFIREDCSDCWCRFICGGGCRADSVVHFGNIHKPYTPNCVFAQIWAANTMWILSYLLPDEFELVIHGYNQKAKKTGEQRQ